MSSYLRKLIETAVVWPRSGTTRNGSPQVGAPQEVACRWLGSEDFDRRAMGLSADGSGMVLLDRAVAVGSLIFQGTAAQAVGSFGPVFEVARSAKIVGRRYDVFSVELGALTGNPEVAVGGVVIRTLAFKWVSTASYAGASHAVSGAIDDGDVLQIVGRSANGTALVDLWNIAGDFGVVDAATLDLTDAGFDVGDSLTVLNYGPSD